MSIDKEFEAFSDEDVKEIIKLLENAVNQRMEQLDRFSKMDVMAEIQKGDDEISNALKMLGRIMPDSEVEKATNKVVDKHLILYREELKLHQAILGKLHLLRSRI